MSFSEQLKKAQEQAIQEENLSPESKVIAIIDDWYVCLKRYCMTIAEQGGSKYHDSLHRYIEYLEDIHTDKREKNQTINDSAFTDYFIEYRRASPEAKKWEASRSVFYHYRYGKEHRTEMNHYHYPHVYGLEKEVAEYVCCYITEKCIQDGLEADVRVTKGWATKKFEERFIENSQFEKWLTGESGKYKCVPVDDKQLYEILIDFSW